MNKPALNVRKLLADARAAATGRGRSSLGTTAALRRHLSAIDTLRAEGVPFSAIAEALAHQGITQGAGDNLKPITASRLTALYGQLKRTDAKRAAARDDRADALEPPRAAGEQPDEPKRKIALAPELTSQTFVDNDADQSPDEEAIRRENRKRSQRFVKTPSN